MGTDYRGASATDLSKRAKNRVATNDDAHPRLHRRGTLIPSVKHGTDVPWYYYSTLSQGLAYFAFYE